MNHPTTGGNILSDSDITWSRYGMVNRLLYVNFPCTKNKNGIWTVLAQQKSLVRNNSEEIRELLVIANLHPVVASAWSPPSAYSARLDASPGGKMWSSARCLLFRSCKRKRREPWTIKCGYCCCDFDFWNSWLVCHNGASRSFVFPRIMFAPLQDCTFRSLTLLFFFI